MRDAYEGFRHWSLFQPASRNASANSVVADVRHFVGEVVLLLHSGAGGVGETLDAKVQDSANGTAFTDVSGLTFTQVTTSNALYPIVVDTRAVRRYIRVVLTISGTFVCSVVLIGRRQTVG